MNQVGYDASGAGLEVRNVFTINSQFQSVVLAVCRSRGRDRTGVRDRGGRLFELTEIATTEDKMLIKEVLSNTSGTSA